MLPFSGDVVGNIWYMYYLFHGKATSGKQQSLKVPNSQCKSFYSNVLEPDMQPLIEVHRPLIKYQRARMQTFNLTI